MQKQLHRFPSRPGAFDIEVTSSCRAAAAAAGHCKLRRQPGSTPLYPSIYLMMYLSTSLFIRVVIYPPVSPTTPSRRTYRARRPADAGPGLTQP